MDRNDKAHTTNFYKTYKPTENENVIKIDKL